MCWEAMLDECCRQQGWDVATGWRTEAGLKSLELDEIAAQLKAACRLVR